MDTTNIIYNILRNAFNKHIHNIYFALRALIAPGATDLTAS